MPAADSADLVVLGGGPAGLAAGWWAAAAGRSVVLLEREPLVGGLARSFEVAGVRVDSGSHRLHPATPPDVLAQLRGLLGEDLQRRPRHGRLHVGGAWVGFPLRPAELVRALPVRMTAGIVRDAALAPVRTRRGGRGEPSYASVLRASLGPTVYDVLYGPYAQKLWGLPGERISADQARRRVTADTAGKVLARTLRARRRGGTGGTRGQTFWYPRRGFGQIVDALADAAVGVGARLRTSTSAERIDVRDDGATVTCGDGSTVEARHVFSTVPLPVLGRIVRPAPPRPVVDAAGRLRFRAMVLVYVVHHGGRWTQHDAHYLPGPQSPVTRLSEPANYRVSADDPRDRSVLCAEVPCAVGDEVWRARDADLADLVDDALARTGLPPRRRSSSGTADTAVQVRRLPHVYPVYELGYESHLAGLDAWARGLPSVTTFGRLGLFAHDNTHHALVMARDAVAALRPDGSMDRQEWERALDRFTAHVVED